MSDLDYLPDDEKPSDTKPKRKVPSDFDDEAAFLEHMRKDFSQDVDADRLNRDAAIDDLQFFIGNQWDSSAKARREKSRKPALTINRLPAFVAQVVGQRRMNETTIKVVADNNEQQAAAKIREGLLRSIQKISRADLAYDKALEQQVICGIGNFQVVLDYASDDVFEQEIRICAIPDPMAVVWDRMSYDLTGADANHVFVVDTIPMTEFKERWPWAQSSDLMVDTTTRGDLRQDSWIGEQDARVVSYWRIRRHKRVLAMMKDGTTKDITGKETPEILSQIVQRPDGSPIMREVLKKYAEMYLCSGLDILEGPLELPISRVPVLRVPGWEINTGEVKHRWGLVRFLKDPQRFHNFSRSVAAEKMMQTPRAVWVASDAAVAGREKEWRQSHLSDDSVLVYSAEAGAPPQRIPPTQMENAWMEMAEISTQDLKDVSNIHEANLGMPSNEVSGAAIMARQRVSDTGTVLYHDNLNQAIEQAGIIVNDLIDIVYDAPRIIRVIGADAKEDLQVINDTGNPLSVDISSGKYSVSVITGPSYATKRMEALASMTSFINAAPQVAAYTMDLVATAMDWPGHEEFARRIRMTLPPGMVDPKDMTPDMVQRQQAQGQAQQQQAALAQQAAEADIQQKNSTAALNTARARNFEAEADATPLKVQNESLDTASQVADREHRGVLESIKVATGG